MIEINKRDIESFVKSVEQLDFKNYHNFGQELWLAVAKEAQKLQTRSNPECETCYNWQGYEYRFWKLGLMSMAWIITLLKLKTEQGHCHTHKKQTGNPCAIGSKFHKQFYDDCIESFETALKTLKSETPKVAD